MKILLDECLPLDFRHSFQSHEAHTVEWAGFKGKKNGELLRVAELAGYDVFVTVDKGVIHQRPSSNRRISIIVLSCATNQMEDLLPLVEAILRKLKSIRRGETVVVSST